VLELRRPKGPILDLPRKPARAEAVPSPGQAGASQGMLLLGATAMLLVAALGSYWFGMSSQRGADMTAVATSTANAPASAAPRAPGAVPDTAAQRGNVNTAVAIQNRSSALIIELRLSAVSDTSWGPDELGDEILPPGADFTVAPDSAKGCRYAVQVKYVDGSTEQRDNVDFCTIETLVFGRR
jgi:hypothetical protein